MKTRELELIRIIDELNDRNAAIKLRIKNKPIVEVYSYKIWKDLGVSECQ